MKQIKQVLKWPGLLLLAAAMAGCKSTDTANVGTMASVEIVGHSSVEVRQVTTEVFLEHGFSQKSGMTFERQGSNWDTVSYGAWSGNPVWIRMRASVLPRSNDRCVVGCDAYIIRDHGEGFMEEEQKLKLAKRSDCEKILNEIKARLNPPAVPAGSGK